jgi:hypothetical protein
MFKSSIVEDDGIADGNRLEVDRDMVVLTECGLVRSVAFRRAAAVAWSWHRILQASAVPGQLLQNSFASPQKVLCAVLCHHQLQPYHVLVLEETLLPKTSLTQPHLHCPVR